MKYQVGEYLFGINDNYPIFIAKIDEEKRQYLVVYLGKYDIHWIHKMVIDGGYRERNVGSKL